MAIETVLFDLDDTLIAEMEWARTGWQLVADFLANRVDRGSNELQQLMAEAFLKDPRRVFTQVASTLRLDAQTHEECIRLYRTTKRPLTVLPDAEVALRYTARLRSGIITDGLHCTQKAKIAGAALCSRVEVVVYTDALGTGAAKPSAIGFQEALARLRMPAASAVYVADNPAKDFLGPKRLGMRTVQIRRLGGVYADISVPQGYEPDVVIASLCDLPAVISRL
jgi:putative hydrolase of the HAD superfamily